MRNEPIRLSVSQAAKLMEVSPKFIKEGLQQGIFPWGRMLQMSSERTFYIVRKQFTECTGIEITDKPTRKNRLQVTKAAALMGVCQQFVRINMQRGEFPWGYAIKMSSHWTYFISAPKFEEYMGIKLEEE